MDDDATRQPKDTDKEERRLRVLRLVVHEEEVATAINFPIAPDASKTRTPISSARPPSKPGGSCPRFALLRLVGRSPAASFTCALKFPLYMNNNSSTRESDDHGTRTVDGSEPAVDEFVTKDFHYFDAIIYKSLTASQSSTTVLRIHHHSSDFHQPSGPSVRYLGRNITSCAEEENISHEEKASPACWKSFEGCEKHQQLPGLWEA